MPELSARTSRPIAIYLNTPTGALARVDLSQLLEGLERRFSQYTDLKPVRLSKGSLQGCGGEVDCIGAQLSESGVDASFLLFLTNFSQPEQPDQISALLIDKGRKVRARSDLVAIEDEPALERFLEALFVGMLRRTLEQEGHWRPFGSVVLGCNRPGAAISVDGRVIGVTIKGKQKLAHLLEGTHEVRIEHPDGAQANLQIDVERRKAQTLEVQLEHRASFDGYYGALYGELAVAGLGVVGSLWAIVYGATHNFSCHGSACDGPRFWTIETLFSGVEEGKGHNNEGRVLALPLGYSLALAGGLAALVTYLWVEQAADMWLPVLIGAAAGGLAYGLSNIR